MHGTAIRAPTATTIHPIGRGSRNACGPANHRGTQDVQSTMNNGAMMSVRSRANTLRLMVPTCYLRNGMSTLAETPVAHTDPINHRILSGSEDRIAGFVRDPIGEIAERSGVDVDTVIERIRAMLRAGTIRRVRQTLMATNLAEGALVAWQLPNEKVDSAFDWMFRQDPFSGHVVIRSTDSATAGSNYRLWTTIKVPQGFSIERHCVLLARMSGAERFRIMPAKRIFALGVGHVRRKEIAPGSKSDELAVVKDTEKVELNESESRVLTALKREFQLEEIIRDLWRARAAEAGVPLENFLIGAEDLNRRGVIGR